MASVDVRFSGSVPANYERYMVPLLFRPYAELLAERARQWTPHRILETAAGTGVVTDALARALPDAEIVATDLNQAMLDVAATRITSPNVIFRQADALELPFDDNSFDLVVCQFGVMFFPDKVQANREAWRVLRPGGRYLLVIWDRIERNVATHTAGKAVAGLFPDDASAFYERIPFRYFDWDTIKADLFAAGFGNVEIETVELSSRAASASDVALGLVQGTPMRSEIEQRGDGMLQRATDAAAEALKPYETESGFEAPMSAHVVTATK
jgi:ubiquinone/menaquinone biosynthesis C-methylase UbiE